MTLADYLESKAEYIFDNYRADFHHGVKPEELDKNKEVVIDRLKIGLRELAKMHYSEFWEKDLGSRHWDVWFTGWVDAYWGKDPSRSIYFVSLTFPHWSLAKILIEKSDKKFEDLFSVKVNVFANREAEETGRVFNVWGNFLNITHPPYIPANFLLSKPIISKLSKSRAFKIFKNTSIQTLFSYYRDALKNYKNKGDIFGDFILLFLDGEYLRYSQEVDENLLVTERPNGGGIDVIKLGYKEYDDIVKAIEHIKTTKQLHNKDILLKDVLSNYVYLKIKGDK